MVAAERRPPEGMKKWIRTLKRCQTEDRILHPSGVRSIRRIVTGGLRCASTTGYFLRNPPGYSLRPLLCLLFAVYCFYCGKRSRYSPDTMNALTMSACSKLPLNWFSLFSQNV